MAEVTVTSPAPMETSTEVSPAVKRMMLPSTRRAAEGVAEAVWVGVVVGVPAEVGSRSAGYVEDL